MKSQASDAIEEVSDIVDQMSCEINDEYLKKCLWMVKPIRNSKGEVEKAELLRINKINAARYTECFTIHNSFVSDQNDK